MTLEVRASMKNAPTAARAEVLHRVGDLAGAGGNVRARLAGALGDVRASLAGVAARAPCRS